MHAASMLCGDVCVPDGYLANIWHLILQIVFDAAVNLASASECGILNVNTMLMHSVCWLHTIGISGKYLRDSTDTGFPASV